MLFGYFTLFVALTISAVAEFYSIVGLTAIFSAAFWPVVIMGASLGVGKITAAVWLKLNWERANWTYKLYLVPAVAFLMVLTSMGIFGYLSKAHSDQSLVSGDALAKVAIYDEKIKIEKDNVDANRKALKQLDEAVDQVMGRSADEKGADKAVAIRRGQQAERGRLLKEITQSQQRITALNEERAPLAVEVRKVEAEVGPIKYIAALVYGDNPDSTILEKAVRLVIILIVAVFDPLALVLILAAQQSLRWARDDDKPTTELQKRTDESLATDDALKIEEPTPSTDTHPPGWMFDKFPYLQNGPAMFFKDLKPMTANTVKEQANTDSVWEDASIIDVPEVVDRPGDYVTPPTFDDDPEESPEARAAKARWKAENPHDTLKHQRWLFERGDIQELPWTKYLRSEQEHAPTSGFGTEFPDNPSKGDMFMRVDLMPNVLYKFNGNDWMAVDKTLTDSYTYDLAYIDHLIAKIDSGEYDPDLLSDSERQQVTDRLQGTK